MVILIASNAIEDYLRATVVNGIELFIVFCGQAFFLVTYSFFYVFFFSLSNVLRILIHDFHV